MKKVLGKRMLKTIIGPYTAADGFMAQRSFKHE